MSPTNPHRWRIAWALAVTQTVGYGVLYYSFGVFVSPMEAEFGWSRDQTSLAFSLALLVSGLASVPVGHLVDRYGGRGLLSLGSLLAGGLLLAWSQIQSLTGLYLVWLGMGVAISAVLYEVAFAVIAVWFGNDRPRAMLIVTMVAGLASTVFVPLANSLLEVSGWRTAVQILAVLLWVVCLPLHLWVVRNPTHGSTHTRASHSGSATPLTLDANFWWLTLSMALVRMAFSGLAAHLVPLLLEEGYTPALAAAAAGTVGAMQLLGRIVFTPLSRKFALSRLTALNVAAHGLGLLALGWVPGWLGLGIFVVLFGSTNGAITLARAALVGQTFPVTQFGRINGRIALAVALGAATAPYLAGSLHTASGNYQSTLLLLSVTTLLAALAVDRVRPRSV